MPRLDNRPVTAENIAEKYQAKVRTVKYIILEMKNNSEARKFVHDQGVRTVDEDAYLAWLNYREDTKNMARKPKFEYKLGSYYETNT